MPYQLRRQVLLGLCGAAALMAAWPAAAQAPLVDYEAAAKAPPVVESAQWRLAFRPVTSVLSQSVAQLRTAPGVSPAALAEADRLIAASAAQPEPEARRTLWHAAAVLLGRRWSPAQEAVGALALRAGTPVSTGGREAIRFETLYPLPAGANAHFSLALYRADATSSATPRRGPLVKTLAEGELGAARSIDIDLGAVADGGYLLIATVTADGEARGELAQSIYVVRDLAARAAALKARLAKVSGHEAAKQTAEYPFALAEGLRAGTRQIIAYDFPRGIARSMRIADDLARGQDDVWQAKGLQDRAYAFAPTGELIPYEIYVPSTWTPTRRWPLVVALHGANLDETNMLGRAGGEMQKLAEQHGFVVVTPLGYRLNSAYGSERGMAKAIAGDDLQRRRRSEEDVMQVLAKVETEYNVDPARRYLTGNSMGGGGTWWIGGHHPEIWAAIAPAAYGGVLPEDVANLSRFPIMAVVGDHDEVGMLPRVKASVATLEAGGVHPQYVEVAGGTHASAYEMTLPRIFDFFSEHKR
ncbi:alpha/beta hydrolase-fold protein [Phenylobacterium sp.]|uniref:carboxylesterase family protein n=1 Tax=Phenylobacterium sp. TaxID=1871053 RepID=UPI002CE43D6E|nr:PHB depolymerase family esterase [Phenylobacterium sp.]HLZ73421.1 PHB depolymerase family esterase [Phenylobacterium sp.]